MSFTNLWQMCGLCIYVSCNMPLWQALCVCHRLRDMLAATGQLEQTNIHSEDVSRFALVFAFAFLHLKGFISSNSFFLRPFSISYCQRRKCSSFHTYDTHCMLYHGLMHRSEKHMYRHLHKHMHIYVCIAKGKQVATYFVCSH